MQAEALSAVLITKNAASQIRECLQSLAFADEIIVVDSGSSDATLDIAREFGARVISRHWPGFGAQKQYAVSQANHDWVLCLDADERISPDLCHSIREILHQPRFHAYKMARSNRFMGRFLRHGEGYPDWSLRLFHRAHARWSDDCVHEKVLTDAPVGSLQGDLLHESAEDLSVYLDKQNRYTTLQAENMLSAGRRAHLGHLILSPILRFIRFYLLRLGFLDGLPGLVHIVIGCCNSFMKYAKLIAMRRDNSTKGN